MKQSSGSGIVVEHTPVYPNIKGSNLATVADSEKESLEKKFFFF
jgi:hypothetical protein